jgi:hypothetical protein
MHLSLAMREKVTRHAPVGRGGMAARLLLQEFYCRAKLALGMKPLSISSNRGSKRFSFLVQNSVTLLLH